MKLLEKASAKDKSSYLLSKPLYISYALENIRKRVVIIHLSLTKSTKSVKTKYNSQLFLKQSYFVRILKIKRKQDGKGRKRKVCQSMPEMQIS